VTFADHNGTDDETAARADDHRADAEHTDTGQTNADHADAEQSDAERGDARDYADAEVDVELDGSSFGEYYDEDDEEYDAEAAERKAAIVEHTGVRLQKVMASSGVASRRVSEDMIAAGRVRVNGEVVREPGRRVDPEKDEILVDGTAVQADTSKRYIMLNKPVGIYSSLRDERGRPDLSRYTDEFEERLFNVGRLDAETSGLLILTNDGDMAHVLAHPSFGVTKMYIAKVEGRMTPQTIARLTKGLDLELHRGRQGAAARRLGRRYEPRRGDAALWPQPHRASHARRGGTSGHRPGAPPLRPAAPRHARPGPDARPD
jgi:16S rRNA U516 pseudouridylate synthase RsuA-like enzyme